jgi:tetratricopeptide (TPR) repeat protein
MNTISIYLSLVLSVDAISSSCLFADAWAAKGGELEKLGRYDDAIKSFDTAPDVYPNHPQWCLTKRAHELSEESEEDNKISPRIKPSK